MTSLLAAYGSDDEGSPPPPTASSSKSSAPSAAPSIEADAFNLAGLQKTQALAEEQRLRDEVASAPDVLLEVSLCLETALV